MGAATGPWPSTRVNHTAIIHVAAGALLLLAGGADARRYRDFRQDAGLYTLPPSSQYTGAITVKFRNDTGLRAASGKERFFDTGLARAQADVTQLRGALARAGAGAPRPVFTRPVAALEAERAQAERIAGEALPDLTLFFEIPVASHPAADDLLRELRSNDLVEAAYARPAPPPPPTADLTVYQGYLRGAAPTNGYDAHYAWSRPGGNGSRARVIDIEYQWAVNHEDLLLASTNILYGTQYTAFGPDHGTASLGILMARSNSYGMAGMAHAARVDMISSCDAGGGWYPANAINQAAALTGPGDIILLEQQAYNYTLGNNCPLEFMPDVYSAIVNATALGRIIIEPAGNGYFDLDGAAWSGIFNRAIRDSGAIMVGAGQATDRARKDFSCHGSRVDIQGWGEKVATLGYTNLTGSTATNAYTKTFNGTSSASALSAAAAAVVQSYARANHGFHLTPLMMRSTLVQSGHPQTFGLAGNIGPLPDLSNAFLQVDALAADPDGDGMATWQEQLAGTDATNRDSSLHFSEVTPPASGAGLVVRWPGVTGKIYRIERGTNLLDGNGLTALVGGNIAGVTPLNSATDTTAVGAGPWFYRIKLE